MIELRCQNCLPMNLQVFVETVSVSGDVQVVRVNGLVLERDYLTTTTDQSIPYSLTFGDITTSHVIVEGKVNSWFLPDEVRRTMRVGLQLVNNLMEYAMVISL